MAWRNIWRNTRRSLLTMGAVAFATVLLIFMLSLQFGNYAAMIDSAVKLRTGHLQVQAKGYMERRDIRLVVPEPARVAAVLDRLPGVAGYTFRASAFALISSRERTYGAIVTGIGDREATVSSLSRTLRQGRFLSERDGGQALVGSILARNLQVKPGDEVAVLGQAWDGSVAATVVHVKGIVSSGQDEFDRSSFYLPLPYFQEVFGMGTAVHEVVVAAKTLEDVPQLKRTLGEQIHRGLGRDLMVLDWKELTPGLMEFITFDMISGFLFYFVLIVVVAFSILNTFFMAIFERKREFGVMMALGSRPARITMLLSLESVMTTVLGSAAGILLGCIATLYFQTHGIAIPGTAEVGRLYAIPERMFPRLSLLSLTIGSGLVLTISFLTAVVPVFKVRRLRALQAMEAWMMFFGLSWRNVWRNPRRTFVILMAVTVAVWSMIISGALLRGIGDQMVRNGVATLTGHIQVHERGYRDDPAVERSMNDPGALHGALRAHLPPGTLLADRVRVNAIASNARHSEGVTLVGIDPEAERKISFIGRSVTSGSYLRPDDGYGVLIGKALMDRLETRIGQKLILMSQDTQKEIASRAFRISGVFRAELESTEKQFIFITLPAARSMLKMGGALSEVCIVLPDRDKVEGTAAVLRAALPSDYEVHTWQQLLPLTAALLKMYRAIIYLWYLVAFMAMGFGIVNTILMAVLERIREFGLLRALGMKPGWIVEGVLTESLLLLVMGMGLGTCLGVLCAAALSYTGIDLSSLAVGVKTVRPSPRHIPGRAHAGRHPGERGRLYSGAPGQRLSGRQGIALHAGEGHGPHMTFLTARSVHDDHRV